ncbi:drug/metabolite transporter (DMT)-like permease [Streptomyces africanus]|uniref:Drug/metabolite transporter (DMT)-like permease n=1 Tax=Streptomyces africanus TaxID=231024 RepID=A0ABU0QI80_9ACTN|nr:DMT family transporter [Streptomyces africanus]MDQ0746217.1 drug/metabolite transporter (DMT)-like permease [Streptomyces africanus]
MGALLALSSAVVYGIVDFAGGLLSRHIHHAAVTFLGQLGGLLLAWAAALLIPADTVHTADLLWGALSGVGSGVAMRFLNRGLSSGAMSVVVPVSAVTGVALSVLCGVLVLGDRPGALAWLGIAVTVPALWFVSGGRGGAGKGTADGLLASAGVAVQYLALGQAAAASGLWPVAAGRVAAVLVLLPDAARHARRLRLPPGRCLQALSIGAGAALGLVLYLLAAQRQLLAIAVVLASLYPALPVILGLALLHERISRRQALGLLGAGVATVLLTLG